MRPFSIRAAGLLALGAIAACPRAATAQQQPESTISKFPHLPSKSASLACVARAEVTQSG